MVGGDGVLSKQEYVLDLAINEINTLLIKEMWDSFEPCHEHVGIKQEYADGKVAQTLIFYKYKRSVWSLFLQKTLVHRNILRLSNGFIMFDVPFQEVCNGLQFNVFRQRFKCELFLKNKRLDDIIRRVLEPLMNQYGYSATKYIDKSRDESAWYSGERRKKPLRRLQRAQ